MHAAGHVRGAHPRRRGRHPRLLHPGGLRHRAGQGKEVRVFHGREHVLEEAISGDVALIRADRADRYGNLTFRYAQANFSPAMATAARCTVAEVRVAEDAPIPHTEIDLPGVYVKRIVAVGRGGRAMTPLTSLPDGLARGAGHRGRHGGQSRHRHPGAGRRLRAGGPRRVHPVGERHHRLRSAGRGEGGRRRPGGCRQPAHHAAAGRGDRRFHLRPSR